MVLFNLITILWFQYVVFFSQLFLDMFGKQIFELPEFQIDEINGV